MMKKVLFGILAFIWLGFSVIFADDIVPNDVDIEVKSPLIQWEATNMKITMIKDWQPLSSYSGTIWIEIVDEDWNPLKENEYTLPWGWWYKFEPTDLGSKEFQRWLEIRKEWKFYIKVSDFIDEIEYWETLVEVVRNIDTTPTYNFDIFTPRQDEIIITDNLEVLGNISERYNSNVSIYIDNELVSTILTESDGSVSYATTNIEVGPHILRLVASDYMWNILWSSEDIRFTYSPQEIERYKSINIEPESWLMVWDMVDVMVYTDELVESVKMNITNRQSGDSDSIFLSKVDNWTFFTNTFLNSAWDIDVSIEISASNNAVSKVYENVYTIVVYDTPEISNVIVETDDEKQTANISRTTSNDTATSFLINYRLWDGDDAKQFDPTRTDKASFTFTDVPYDTNVYLNIIPYRDNAKKHWASSQTITFKIVKPVENKCGNGIVDEWEDCDNCPSDLWSICIPEPEVEVEPPVKCTVQNISARTKKVWENYYLLWDRVDNISKYIVYSSVSPDWSDKVKVYETKDTSYEYPFDYTSEEDKFMYFWIVWICDDWQELQLTWATKVQVWPTENFFLLMCITFIIFFWIKLFRESE